MLFSRPKRTNAFSFCAERNVLQMKIYLLKQSHLDLGDYFDAGEAEVG